VESRHSPEEEAKPNDQTRSLRASALNLTSVSTRPADTRIFPAAKGASPPWGAIAKLLTNPERPQATH